MESVTTTKKRYESYFWLAWLMCGLGAVFYIYEYFLRISPSVMTTEIMQSYMISAGSFGNLMGFFYYAYTPAQLVVGITMDRFGPRRILTIACLICAIGSYLFANSPALWMASAGRFMVGFGSAFAFVGVLKLATIWLPPDRFAMVSGLTSALGTIGAMFGQVILTELVKRVTWQETVLYTAVIGVVLTAILGIFLRDHAPYEEIETTVHRSTFSEIFTSFGKIASNPQIWIVGLIGCLMYLPTSAFAEAWANSYFRTAYQFSMEDAAFAVSAIFFGFTIGGPVNGWLSDHLRTRRLPLLIGSLGAAILITIILYVPNLPKPAVFALLFLFGAFYGAQVIVFAVGREVSPANAAATAVALTNMLVMLGGSIFQPVIGVFLDMSWNGEMADSLPIYTGQDYQLSLIVLPLALLGSGLLSLLLKETHCKVVKDS